MNKFLVIIFFILSLPSFSMAKPEYAEKTGKDCIYCHISQTGGTLTEYGELFLKTELRPAGIKRVIRLVFYFFHFLFGILWFGTILYVHIILKPGYASKGLPRGELILGWVSIIVMGITGFILTLFRINNISELMSTYFGIILIIKIILFILMVISASIVTFILGPKMKKKIVKNISPKQGEFTLEELELFDGREGRNCFIAYNGEIFDLTESKLWKDGTHMGRHNAGSDLTYALKSAPHNADVLKRFQKVGVLVSSDLKKQKAVKIFFALAYTNLIIVFLIVFLITLWKW